MIQAPSNASDALSRHDLTLLVRVVRRGLARFGVRHLPAAHAGMTACVRDHRGRLVVTIGRIFREWHAVDAYIRAHASGCVFGAGNDHLGTMVVRAARAFSGAVNALHVGGITQVACAAKPERAGVVGALSFKQIRVS